MIYTVTLNPSVDYIVEVEEFTLGGLNRMKRDMKLPGGKGINVSRVLKQLGVENTATGFLGGFTGGYIEQWLRQEMIASDFVHITDDTRINIKLKAGEETEINGAGPEISQPEIASLLHKLDALKQGDVVILSGSTPPSLGGDFYSRLIAVCKQKGAEFVIDTTGQALKDALPLGPLLVKPNHHELAELFGVQISTREEIITYGRKLLEAGARHVLVSMAGEGALFISEQGVYHAAVSCRAGEEFSRCRRFHDRRVCGELVADRRCAGGIPCRRRLRKRNGILGRSGGQTEDRSASAARCNFPAVNNITKDFK